VAERAAWNFIADEGGALELSVVNPVGVFGPVLGSDFSASILLCKLACRFVTESLRTGNHLSQLTIEVIE
jgi:hypothetical protein